MAHLALLILSAMLLINVVMIKLAEKHLVQSKLQTGRLLLNTLTQKVGYEIACRNKSWEMLASNAQFMVDVEKALGSANFSMALALDKHGTKVFSYGTWGDAETSAMSLSRETLVTRKMSSNFFGTVWGVVWLASEMINISAPVFIEERFAGVVTIGAHLSPLYQSLREAENIILFYIAMNTIILVLFGIHLLSRTVVRPIHELLNITDEFKDMDSVPALADSPPNEIGQLFRSLNLMLNRLEQNKKEMKDYMSSLEKANLEIKKAQDEIIRSEKFASVGRLATGVAHEIGNPIGIVLGYLELLREKNLEDEDKQDYLSRMESEVTRINQIIRDLLDFSRGSGGSVIEVGIHELITETIYMLGPQPMMAHVRMTHTFNASEDLVKADPNQLKQVFLNIIINAADAMGEDASTNILTIESENKGHYIELRFTDTGPGITTEEIAHIFDPFYSTKDPGKGTGLGLSVCYSIINGLGGEIRAESSIGQGTTIIISLPLYEI